MCVCVVVTVGRDEGTLNADIGPVWDERWLWVVTVVTVVVVSYCYISDDVSDDGVAGWQAGGV